MAGLEIRQRCVFLPYTREVFAATREWVQDRDLFPDMPPSLASYDEAALPSRDAAARDDLSASAFWLP